MPGTQLVHNQARGEQKSDDAGAQPTADGDGEPAADGEGRPGEFEQLRMLAGNQEAERQGQAAGQQQQWRTAPPGDGGGQRADADPLNESHEDEAQGGSGRGEERMQLHESPEAGPIAGAEQGGDPDNGQKESGRRAGQTQAGQSIEGLAGAGGEGDADEAAGGGAERVIEHVDQAGHARREVVLEAFHRQRQRCAGEGRAQHAQPGRALRAFIQNEEKADRDVDQQVHQHVAQEAAIQDEIKRRPKGLNGAGGRIAENEMEGVQRAEDDERTGQVEDASHGWR